METEWKSCLVLSLGYFKLTVHDVTPLIAHSHERQLVHATRQLPINWYKHSDSKRLPRGKTLSSQTGTLSLVNALTFHTKETTDAGMELATLCTSDTPIKRSTGTADDTKDLAPSENAMRIRHSMQENKCG